MYRLPSQLQSVSEMDSFMMSTDELQSLLCFSHTWYEHAALVLSTRKYSKNCCQEKNQATAVMHPTEEVYLKYIALSKREIFADLTQGPFSFVTRHLGPQKLAACGCVTQSECQLSPVIVIKLVIKLDANSDEAVFTHPRTGKNRLGSFRRPIGAGIRFLAYKQTKN